MGIRVPEQVAIVGYDDDPWAPYLDVPLTTVLHPTDRLCEEAMRLLSDRLEGEGGRWRRVTLNPELVVRQSSRR